MLRRDLDVSRKTINDIQQCTLRDCLENKGIPVDPKEDTNSLVIKTASFIGIELNKDDISISHCLNNPVYNNTVSGSAADQRHGTPNVIVKFVLRDVRDSFYRARKNLHGKSTEDLGFGRIAMNISESLSPANRELFK